MADYFDGKIAREDDAEAERLIGELISEIGATEIPTEIRSLALKLQTLIDAPKSQAESPA